MTIEDRIRSLRSEIDSLIEDRIARETAAHPNISADVLRNILTYRAPRLPVPSVSAPHGATMTAPRRRPRSANSLKDLGRLLNAADTAHEVGRAARLAALASEINDTEAFLEKLGRAVEAMDLLFQGFGVRAIVCGSRLHIYEEWRHLHAGENRRHTAEPSGARHTPRLHRP
jgi:hypothetical protein